MKDILERAFFSYARDRFKRAPHDHLPRCWPDYDQSGVFVYNMRDYVILRSAAGQLLAVYRIRQDNGTLRRLFNFPLVLQHPPEKGNTLYRKKS